MHFFTKNCRNSHISQNIVFSNKNASEHGYFQNDALYQVNMVILGSQTRGEFLRKMVWQTKVLVGEYLDKH